MVNKKSIMSPPGNSLKRCLTEKIGEKTRKGTSRTQALLGAAGWKGGNFLVAHNLDFVDNTKLLVSIGKQNNVMILALNTDCK